MKTVVASMLAPIVRQKYFSFMDFLSSVFLKCVVVIFPEKKVGFRKFFEEFGLFLLGF